MTTISSYGSIAPPSASVARKASTPPRIATMTSPRRPGLIAPDEVTRPEHPMGDVLADMARRGRYLRRDLSAIEHSARKRTCSGSGLRHERGLPLDAAQAAAVDDPPAAPDDDPRREGARPRLGRRVGGVRLGAGAGQPDPHAAADAA